MNKIQDKYNPIKDIGGLFDPNSENEAEYSLSESESDEEVNYTRTLKDTEDTKSVKLDQNLPLKSMKKGESFMNQDLKSIVNNFGYINK